MRSLLLLRHAKSSWGDASCDDHDRSLDARGRRAAVLMGGFIAECEPAPDLVLCSSARRTVETLERLRPLLPDEPEVAIERGLYLAGHEDLCDRIARVSDSRGSLLVIGHNPGIESLARFLARRKSERIPPKYPTAALAGFTLPGGWADVARDCRFAFFVRPKDLV